MKITCSVLEEGKIQSDLFVLITEVDAEIDFDYLSRILSPSLNSILGNLNFSDKDSDTLISLENKDIPNLLVIKIKNISLDPVEIFREAGSSVQRYLKKIKGKRVHLHFHKIDTDLVQAARGLAEGLLLSEYRFLEFKSPSTEEIPSKHHITFLFEKHNFGVDIRRQLKRTETIIAGVNGARTLANRPANILTPKKLAREVQKLFRSVPSVKVENIQGEKLASLKMNAFLSVAKGSQQPPALIIMKYKSGLRNARKLAILGKGITFDSGGISIKPAASMEDMKFDMAGAATVVGVFQILSVLKPEIDVIGVIPAAENALGGNAYRPGDIIRSFSGKTIEVVNTDAEGRLILADALAYVEKRFHPEWMIDIATLTGSIVTALGEQCCGIFSKDESLLQSFKHAAELSGERVWPMPMWDEYKKPLESKVADIKHLGGREAGSITAAKFLEAFVSESSWLHMDIAGTAYHIKSKKYLGDGASGYGVRLLWEVINYLQKMFPGK